IGGLGGTLDTTLDGLGNKLGILNQPLDGIGNILEALLGSPSPKSGAGIPSVKPPILTSFPSLAGRLALFDNQVKATSQSQSKSTATTNG
uniref:hypothetical protein n=1 Tax=Klebsiella pneumoniae TaxID=573 RepID=UPI0025A067F9